MPWVRPSDLWRHCRVVRLRSAGPFIQVYADLQPRVVFAGDRDSRECLGGNRDPLGSARASEAGDHKAATDLPPTVGHGAVQSGAIPIRGARILFVCWSAAYFSGRGTVS